MTAPALDDVLTRVLAPWVLDGLLRSFDDAQRQLVASQFGGSWGDHGEWFQVERDGIHIRAGLGRDDIAVFGWRQIRQRLAHVPADAAAALHSVVVAAAAHHHDFPTFKATPAAAGCGRIYGEGPPTYAQHLYDLEHAAHRDRLNAWYANARPLDRAAQAAKRVALQPLALQLELLSVPP